jgi:hypothetical protein
MAQSYTSCGKKAKEKRNRKRGNGKKASWRNANRKRASGKKGKSKEMAAEIRELGKIGKRKSGNENKKNGKLAIKQTGSV